MTKPSFCSALIISIACALLVAAWLPVPAQAARLALPPRPTPVLPAPSSSTSEDEGYIGLRVQSAQADLWTVVQWQDRSGVWHDVEGWQGTLDEIVNGEGNKVWWVGKADMSTGPFRWLVYQNRKGKLLVKSESFYLPHATSETVQVEVSLAP